MLVPTAIAVGVVTVLLLALFSVVGHGNGDDVRATAGEGPDVPPGAVLLMRHALTDQTQTDADPQARGGCAQQRNLSAEGVTQAQRIGRGMADLPISAVYASPFCRTVDTAEALDVAPVTVEQALISTTSGLDASAQQSIIDAEFGLILRELGGDDVVVMVTHTQNIEVITGMTVGEGDAVVLVPAATGGFTVEGVIPATAW